MCLSSTDFSRRVNHVTHLVSTMSTESVLFVLIMFWWRLTVCGRSGNMVNDDKAMWNLPALYHQVKC